MCVGSMDWNDVDDSNEYDGEEEDNSSEGEQRLFKETDYYFNKLKSN